MNERDKKYIAEIVRMTVAELQRAGMLKDSNASAYTEANEILRHYYDSGEKDEAVRGALAKLERDQYAKILPLYYGYGYTIDEIADDFGVETSTISRNKKRLCLEVFRLLQ